MPRETTKTVAPTAQVELQYDNKEDNPLVLKIKEIITSIDEIKEGFYPKGLNMKKVYGAKAPSKADFVALRSNLRAVLKDVNAQIKVKTKRQVKPGSGFLRMVRLRPELSAFIGTEKKGLGEVYSDALLTSWFTNYFYNMKLKKWVSLIRMINFSNNTINVRINHVLLILVSNLFIFNVFSKVILSPTVIPVNVS